MCGWLMWGRMMCHSLHLLWRWISRLSDNMTHCLLNFTMDQVLMRLHRISRHSSRDMLRSMGIDTHLLLRRMLNHMACCRHTLVQILWLLHVLLLTTTSVRRFTTMGSSIIYAVHLFNKQDKGYLLKTNLIYKYN